MVADEIMTRVRSGELFEALARQYSKDSSTSDNGGDLGALTRAQLPDALGDVVFSMKEGEIRGPDQGRLRIPHRSPRQDPGIRSVAVRAGKGVAAF